MIPILAVQGTADRRVAQYLQQGPPAQQNPTVVYEGRPPLLRQSPQANGGDSVAGGQDDELLLGHHLLDFWTNICVCHNLITEENAEGGPPMYQVSLLCHVLLQGHCFQLLKKYDSH